MLEQEQRQSHEVVRIGQEFYAFNPSGRKLLLQLDGPPAIPFNIYLGGGVIGIWQAYYDVGDVEGVMFPFEPEKGYRITRGDFDGNSWLINDMSSDKQTEVVDTSYYRSIHAATSDLRSLGVLDDTIPDIARKLRLQLFFPSGLSFEGRTPPEEVDRYIAINIEEFYPLDTGPLPYRPYNFLLYVKENEDPEELSKVRARFVLAAQKDDTAQKPTKPPRPVSSRVLNALKNLLDDVR